MQGENSSSLNDKLTILSVKRGGTRGEMAHIDLSNGSSLSVFAAIILQEGIRSGEELSEVRIDELKEKSELLAAEKRGISLLARSQHSAHGLKLKLFRRGFRESVISRVIEGLEESGLLDDRAYCESWLSSRLRRHPEGRSALIAGLRKRGINRELAEDMVQEIVTPRVEEECARRVIEKLKGSAPLSNSKMISRLHSRGFSSRLIRAVLEQEEESL